MAAVAGWEAWNPRREIPSVERLLQAPAGAALAARWRREHVVETTRAVLEEIRRATGDGTAVPPADEVLRRVAVRLQAPPAPRLVPVVNASGGVLPTKPGPAPPPQGTIAALGGAAPTRTHADDYRRALGPSPALLLKVHPSNYRVVGFTAGVELAELVAIGREAGVPVMEDLGSGALVELAEYGLPREPVVRERVAAGVDLVTFSGDKLLGGPQAGIVVGRRERVARPAENPLRPALPPAQLALAALRAALPLS